MIKNKQSYLLEVLAGNAFHQQYVILNTSEEMIKMGLIPQSVRSVACFEKPVLKGFHLTAVPLTTGHIPGQQAIIDHFVNYPALFNLRHHPVIGLVQEGPYAGKEVALFTQIEIRRHFSIDAIRLSIKENKPYQQAQWRYAENYREAQPVYCHSENQEILDVLRCNYAYLHLKATENDRYLFRQEIGQLMKELHCWDSTHHQNRQSSTAIKMLMDIYVKLTKVIRCEEYHHQLLDTLYHLKRAVMCQQAISDIKIHVITGVLEKIANGE